MTKTKLLLIIPLLLILTLSACSFKSEKDDNNKEKADKETYIIKYALNKEDVKDRLNSLPGLGSFNSEDDINVFELNCKKLASLSDYVYFYFTEPKELADFQMTKLDGNLIEYFKLEKGPSFIGDLEIISAYNYKSYYQIKNGPIFLLSGKSSGELNEKDLESFKKSLRSKANIFYSALKYPDFSIVGLAYSYNNENYYFYDCWKNIFSEISMDCKLDSDCMFTAGYNDSFKIISIAKNNDKDLLNEFISKIEAYNLYSDFPKKLEAYNEHISRLKPICQNNICSLGLIIDDSDENYLLYLYNNAFNETIVKSISYDNLEERYNFFVWLNSKDDYIKGRIYPEDNIDLNGYEIKYLNNKVEYSQFKEEVEVLLECTEDENGTCVERERYHYNFSVYYKLENGFLFEFIGDGRGNLKDLDKDELLGELRFTINLLELPLKHKDFKYTDFAISYNGKDYYFIDLYRREFSNLSMNCQTDNDCWVFPYYCDIIPYIPLSSYNKRGDINNLRQKVEYFNNNFSGKCIELPDNFFASQCLNNVCTLTRGEG